MNASCSVFVFLSCRWYMTLLCSRTFSGSLYFQDKVQCLAQSDTSCSACFSSPSLGSQYGNCALAIPGACSSSFRVPHSNTSLLLTLFSLSPLPYHPTWKTLLDHFKWWVGWKCGQNDHVGNPNFGSQSQQPYPLICTWMSVGVLHWSFLVDTCPEYRDSPLLGIATLIHRSQETHSFYS